MAIDPNYYYYAYNVRGILWYRLKAFDQAIADYNPGPENRATNPNIPLPIEARPGAIKGITLLALVDYDQALSRLILNSPEPSMTGASPIFA